MEVVSLPEKAGFQKWVKLCLDDLPLIRPPKQHTMVHMTGGITNLYKRISKIRQDNGCKDVPIKAEDQILLEKSDVEKVPLTKFYQNKKSKEIEEEKEKKERDKLKETEKEKENEKNSSEKESAKEEKEISKNEVNGEKNEEMDKMEMSNGEVDVKEADADAASEKVNCEVTSNKEQIDETDRKKRKLSEDGSTNDKDEVSCKNAIDDEGGGKNDTETDKGSETTKNDKESNVTENNEVNSKEIKSPEVKSSNKEKALSEEDEKSEKEEKEEQDSDDEEEDEDEEEEETTEFTDDDGEFVPVLGMPLLANRYKYLQVLGRGQSALIIKVEDTFCKNKQLAIKVLHRVYKPIGSQEADILLELQRADPYFHVPFARVKTQFLYGPHYCLVFECLLPTPLYTYYDQKDIRGSASLPYIRHLAVKLLTVMGFLQKQNVIHADLKPENILLRDEEDLNSIMVVDFGNALRNTEEELSLYYSDFELQTLLYRAPEVIFGLRFSLEVDMWSLGCLLAECYIGKPLFFGKTKEEILTKICKLLGPFPKEFSEGMCGDEFSQFIGRPLSRYQRVENLSKRLNKCTDMPFLLLVERMLTYLPEQRVVPADAACHSFVAQVSPVLYLTITPGLSRYPTILLDASSYPHRPEHAEDDDEEDHRAACRKRLLSYTHKPQKHEPLSQSSVLNSTSHTITTTTAADNLISVNKQNKTVSVAPTNASQAPVSRSDVKETLKSMGLRCEDFTISVYSKEQAHAILRKQGVEVTNHMPPSNAKQQQGNAVRSGRGTNNQDAFRSSSVSVSRPNNSRPGVNRNAQGNAPRPSAPQSRPAPPAPDDDDDDDDCVILDPPVNNNPRPQPQKPRLPQQFQLMGTTVQVNRGSKRPYSGPQNPLSSKRHSMMGQYHNTSVNYQQPYRQMPQQRFSARQRQQYHQQMMQQQYMDDYSDEDSGGESSVQDTLKRLKNYNISITCRRNEQPPSRQGGGNRQFSHHRQLAGNVSATYHGGHGRNSGGMRQSNQMMREQTMARAHQQMMRGQHAMNRQNMMRAQNMQMMQSNMMRGDSDYEDENMMDSDEEAEADMAKYLECEIGEDNIGQMVEGDEELHFDDDEDHMDEEDIRRPRHMTNALRQTAHNSNPEKGKYSHLATKKRSAPPPQPPPQCEEVNTSIEEVTLSRGSEPDSEHLQPPLENAKAGKDSQSNEDEKDENEEDEGNESAEEDEDDKGAAEMVDSMLEQHLQAVCGAQDGEEKPGDSEDADEAEEPRQEDAEPESPMNEEELLGDEEEKEANQAEQESAEPKPKAAAKATEDNVEEDLKDDDEGEEIDEELEKELLAGDGDL